MLFLFDILTSCLIAFLCFNRNYLLIVATRDPFICSIGKFSKNRRTWFILLYAVFMFSLAGIPPLACFLGKLYVFAAAVEGGWWWLAASTKDCAPGSQGGGVITGQAT